MAIVHIRINDRDYDIACDDGQEEHLRLLADEVDERVRQLVFQMGGSPGESMSLLLTALMMADEAIETKKEIDRLSSEVTHLVSLVEQSREEVHGGKIAEMEAAMALTLEEIASRIEKMADQIEVR